MTTAVLDRLELPTGLSPGEVRSLRRQEKIDLAGWHTTVAGDDNGREWLPAAVRVLGLDAQLYLAGSEDATASWQGREIRRVEADPVYFTRAYGSVRDDEEPGPPVPFDLWPEQVDVLHAIQEHRRVVILKARQLGLTWIALHDALHFILVDPAGANGVVLGLSQDGGYAKRLLERARIINELQPPYLRGVEDRETRGSKTEFKLAGRGRMVSLPGTPAAPRSWQADKAICDEWAFVRNGGAGPTMRALLPAARRIVVVSSGDGGPDEEGDGQAFAELYTKAAAGENDWHPIFLPTSTHPRRTPEWRANERDNYDTDEDFLAEHPETPDEALIGAGKDRFFQLGDIAAAVKLGGELDALLGTPEMPPPAGDELHLGMDWGENSAGYVIWPLEGGGVYVPPCESTEPGKGAVGVKDEPSERAVALHEMVLELQEVSPQTGRVEPPIGEARYDAAGIQSMRTFLAIARDRFSHQYAGREVRSRKVPFGKYKDETARYMRRLFKRAGQGRATQVIAISPANPILIRQLRGLECDRDLWKKEDDHGPDALVAGIQRIARLNRQAREEHE